MSRNGLPDPEHLFNRHFSWLQFNQRVLEEARDPDNPVLERVKFLAITASNLDEFVEVRVAGLLQQVEHGHSEPGPDGRVPAVVLGELSAKIHSFVKAQYSCWQEELVPALAGESIRVLSLSALRPAAREHIENFYARSVEPLLTPVTVDPAHPFPHVLNKALCLAFLLKRKRRGSHTYLGVVTVPRALPRLVRLPSPERAVEYVFLHDVVHAFADRLYHGYEILSAAPFRVTRNSNLYLEEEESRSILDSVDTQLHRRRKGAAVRLEIETGANQEIIDRLQANFHLAPWQVFNVNGPVNLSRLFHMYDQTPRPDLKYKSFAPRELSLKPGAPSLFELIRKRDLLLHHPYDSYSAVVRFIESAAQDPDVLSIKQTLYRTSENSPIVRALIEAAAKKEVAVVVELKARFDEASNISWARNLQEAGVQVFHGVVGLKTHCKLALVARRESNGQIRRYAHLGTGNYNPSTARFYTDLSLLTTDPQITSSVHHVFNYLTAYSERPSYRPLFVAPLNLGKNCVSLIERETSHARAGRPAFIIAKVNALLDEKIIQALYRASQAGVQIELLVRGACALRPGVRGISSRIRVRSVIGRFLEHSRIFIFGNGGKSEVYLGSADWMHRNIYERVEVMFHIRDAALCAQIFDEVIEPYLADTQKTRVLLPNGEYVHARDAHKLLGIRNGFHFNVQEFLIGIAEGREEFKSVPPAPRSMKLSPPRTPAPNRPDPCGFANHAGTLPVALHRYNRSAMNALLSTIVNWLIGPEPATDSRPGRLWPRWIFLRALGLIYFSAFHSLLFQITGLIGPTGILPAGDYLQAVSGAIHSQRFWFAPTLLWFGSSNHVLLAICWTGMIASLLLVLNFWPRATLAVCFVCFLSFVSAAQDFSGYQSDGMLLEAGFISLFFAPPGFRPALGHAHPPSRLSRFLLQWEWFRIYFESGVAKIASGDLAWRNLTAMDDYYQNGPLPTWLGWYVQQLPHWFHAFAVVLTLAIELVLVWMLFLPRRFRIICFFIVTPFEISIILTANYTFLNYLVLALGFLLLDDRFIEWIVPQKIRQLIDQPPALDAATPPPSGAAALPQQENWRARVRQILSPAGTTLAAVCLLWVLYATSAQLAWMLFRGLPLPETPVRLLEPFRIANRYGLFAVMTHGRYEIEFQGSRDGKNWLAYPFRYKPQDLTQPPGIYAPYQPRFDWNLWFASLGSWRENHFVVYTEERLLRSDPDVLALFAANPFAGGPPPAQVRAVVWQYWFTDLKTKRAQGIWWRRELLGAYAPALAREPDGKIAMIDLPLAPTPPE